jgi:hypothetical protein
VRRVLLAHGLGSPAIRFADTAEALRVRFSAADAAVAE